MMISMRWRSMYGRSIAYISFYIPLVYPLNRVGVFIHTP